MKNNISLRLVTYLLSVAALLFPSCKKEDCNKPEQLCKVSKTYGGYITVDVNTGQTTEHPFELKYKYDKNCNFLIRPLDETQKDSCVYESGRLKEIIRLPKLNTSFNYFFNYSPNGNIVVMEGRVGINDSPGTLDSLFYENDVLKRARIYHGGSSIEGYELFEEDEFEYYPDGNLHKVGIYYFHPTNGKYLFEVETYSEYTEWKNPSYKSPFPDERNLSLCKNLFQKYQRINPLNNYISAQSTNTYIDEGFNDCGYLKFAYNGKEIKYKCGCE